MYLSAQSIRRLHEHLKSVGSFLFDPFVERSKSHGMTYGLGPAGYDVRVEFDKEGIIEEVVLKPGDTLLASTIEKFHIPSNYVIEIKDKSTWARNFLTVQNTVGEPGWTGYLTLELINHNKRHRFRFWKNKNIKLKRGMPIAQIMFAPLDEHSELSYERITGKYQNQPRGPVEAILEK